MSLELFKRVALIADVPEHKLCKGDVAVLLEFVPHPTGRARGCVLEMLNAVGRSIVVAVVPESSIEPLSADEVLSVRRIA